MDDDPHREAFAQRMRHAADALERGRASVLAYVTDVDTENVLRVGGIRPDSHGALGLTTPRRPRDA